MEQKKRKFTTREIVHLLGIKNICAALDVKRNAVDWSMRKNQFPAAWWPEIRRLGRTNKPKVVVPEYLFNWKRKKSEKSAA